MNITSTHLLKIAEQWELTTFIDDWKAVEQNADIIIGVVGEYSAGKSTLLNALLRKPDLLPRELKPTTGIATLIKVDASVSQPTRGLHDGDTIITPVTDEMWRITIEKGTGFSPIVSVPPSEAFRDGFIMVDTPGIGGTIQSHANVINETVKRIHGAVVCVDAQRGNLTTATADLITDLSRTIAPHQILIVITKSDTLGQEELDIVQSAIVEEFADLVGLAVPDVKGSVVAVSATSKSTDVAQLTSLLGSRFYDMQALLHRDVVDRQRMSMGPRLLDLLKERQTTLSAQDADLAARVETLRTDLTAIKGEISQGKATLEGARSQLERRLKDELQPLMEQAAHTQGAQELAEAVTQIDKTYSEILGSFEVDATPQFRGLEVQLKATAANAGRAAKAHLALQAAIREFARSCALIENHIHTGLDHLDPQAAAEVRQPLTSGRTIVPLDRTLVHRLTQDFTYKRPWAIRLGDAQARIAPAGFYSRCRFYAEPEKRALKKG